MCIYVYICVYMCIYMENELLVYIYTYDNSHNKKQCTEGTTLNCIELPIRQPPHNEVDEKRNLATKMKQHNTPAQHQSLTLNAVRQDFCLHHQVHLSDSCL